MGARLAGIETASWNTYVILVEHGVRYSSQGMVDGLT